MGDLALLLGAIAAVITAIGTTAVGLITALRASPRERKSAARGALHKLAEAAKDGVITPEELQAVLEDEGGDDS